MATVASCQGIRNYVLDHMLHALRRTPAHDEPFSHFYVEDVFPDDVYAEMMDNLPEPAAYQPLSVDNYHNAEGVSTRDVISLDEQHLQGLPDRQRDLWEGIAAAMVAPELKTLVFQKLATDLSARFGVPRQQVPKITSFCKASLFRDLDGYEIAPHPDGRAKIVTMQLYLPRDRTQLELGTALYKRRFKSLSGIYSWHGRFEKVKQFIFQPNSGYAFAVSNSWNKKSWHGRESLPEGCGVRNTLLNIYFARDDRQY
jgi:hypothetical protein